ncbi:hypothetical protein N3K66_009093 [Trichothecium roseum]|uniref:Uncharacterized protein n=1 Tax=Trichothecium roseum TaxID=47278 RepID=A0ACC0UR87_9HYPO|nr:hypothetical protein N3K66_009093 [Trichothecium roseum]
MTRKNMEKLQSNNTGEVLDIVDSLRSQGIGRYIDLPQVIVCGDQSSGKSSVLEAISGLSFPIKGTLCTRFAIELILRHSDPSDKGLKASIIPGSDRSKDELRKIEGLNFDTPEFDLSLVVERATVAMGISHGEKTFCNDILRIEVSSPNQLNLTLVDLPGLFMAGDKDQSIEDSEMVKRLVLSYMSQPRSVILAVVSAKNEFALQQVTRHAREVDPSGHRTIGLITKPDTLDKGSPSEQKFLNLARNLDVRFHLGWHVVKNRDYESRHETNPVRDAAEKDFLSKGVWASLDQSQLGIDALRIRLSKVLREQILAQLPSVLDDIDTCVSQCRGAVEKLGTERKGASEQRRYLLSLSSSFSSLIKAAVLGDYSNREFFSPMDTDDNIKRKLRAEIQRELRNFSSKLETRGHAKTIVDRDEVPKKRAGTPPYITRAQFTLETKKLLSENQGRELPGTFNPMIIAEMFSAHCKPWKSLTKVTTERILCLVQDISQAALRFVTDTEVVERFRIAILDPALAHLAKSVNDKVAELLEPHISGHPITYNHYLTENIQHAQMSRHMDAINNAISSVTIREPSDKVDLTELQDVRTSIIAATIPNMENYAAMTAIDAMEAYYKVALKRFVDDFSVLAVEQCLLRELCQVFSYDLVCDFSDEQIQELTMESDEKTAQRARETKKLENLMEGQTRLKQLSNESRLLA